MVLGDEILGSKYYNWDQSLVATVSSPYGFQLYPAEPLSRTPFSHDDRERSSDVRSHL